MRKRDNRRSYLNDFEGPQADSKLAEALRTAVDTRQFELDLYWRRTGYYWALTAAALAGYFALERADLKDQFFASLTISCLGLVFAWGWWLANFGSKFWYQQWERQVELLEDGVIGPLFKSRTIRERPFGQKWPGRGRSYSITKINQGLVFFVILLWVWLIARRIMLEPSLQWGRTSTLVVMLSVTALAMVLLAFLGRTGRHDDITVDVLQSEIRDSNQSEEA